jgi:hypothetical protein
LPLLNDRIELEDRDGDRRSMHSQPKGFRLDDAGASRERRKFQASANRVELQTADTGAATTHSGRRLHSALGLSAPPSTFSEGGAESVTDSRFEADAYCAARASPPGARPAVRAANRQRCGGSTTSSGTGVAPGSGVRSKFPSADLSSSMISQAPSAAVSVAMASTEPNPKSATIGIVRCPGRTKYLACLPLGRFAWLKDVDASRRGDRRRLRIDSRRANRPRDDRGSDRRRSRSGKSTLAKGIRDRYASSGASSTAGVLVAGTKEVVSSQDAGRLARKAAGTKGAGSRSRPSYLALTQASTEDRIAQPRGSSTALPTASVAGGPKKRDGGVRWRYMYIS